MLLALTCATIGWAQDDRDERIEVDRSEREMREVAEPREPTEREDATRVDDRTDSRDGERAGPDRDSDDSDDRDDLSASGRDDKEDGDDDRLGNRERQSAVEGAQQARIDRIDVERGSDGRERRRGEVLVIATHRDLDKLNAAGYLVLSQGAVPGTDTVLTRLRVARSESIEAAASRLRSLLGGAAIAPNHIYRLAQSKSVPPAVTTAPGYERGLIGLIDAGVDLRLPSLIRAIRASRSFTTGSYTPRAHGTRVAQIAAAQGASLVVADVFAPDESGVLAAPADAIAGALSWFVEQRVPVINISIEGPSNPVLEEVVNRTLKAGIAVVAAVGNGGPAAAPAYPAAYGGVIAVTAVDDQGRVYRRANRGNHVVFAARGVRLGSVDSNGRALPPISGTSFAAPVVAAEIAARLADRSRTLPAVVAELQREAIDRGAAGRDPIYGWGELRSR